MVAAALLGGEELLLVDGLGLLVECYRSIQRLGAHALNENGSIAASDYDSSIALKGSYFRKGISY